ncbi:RloB domain-containing protein [Kushneria sp. AK178]
MSKRAPRIKLIVSIVVEGYTEKAFFELLREYFSDSRYKFNINNRKGGSPEAILEHAKEESKDCEQTYMVIDSDKGNIRDIERESQRENINVILNEPCIERTFLNILGESAPESSQNCKKKFQRYINTEKVDKRIYRSHFTRELLLEKQRHNTTLKAMIAIFVNGQN